MAGGGDGGYPSAEAEGEAAVACEALRLLQIDPSAVSPGAGRAGGVAPCSRNVLRKRRRWERVLAAKRRKRRQERERSRARHAGDRGAAGQDGGRAATALVKERLLEARASGPRLCVDLGLVHRMSQKMDTTQESYLDLFPLDAIVYLTPDSENVLEDVDPSKVYVLGGLVDESIHKKLTLQRAQEQSLQTARLPIREYMVKAVNTKNYHSETLAINQVFDVLSTYYETRSWPSALKAGVTSGKGYVLPDAVKEVKIPQHDNAQENSFIL
ncbi:tRNA methyltransferase 10 homolog B isoform X4 [Rissa tridactyla]|uniref:tRNA methyltransferase 10 homolog B isoform X4 n=1 Tax=Rissa tridactyla TaxID=75485 RepID=UPI0023BA7B5F|nr:tRNA methyltransferase 10 homolog B isoform X4 [Rissa tridactyla]